MPKEERIDILKHLAGPQHGNVWLGDLAGMEVVPVLREGPQRPNLQLRLTHRCGNEGALMVGMGMDGISDDSAVMLGNLVEFAAQFRNGHVCPPHQPSPEHQERVQRWQDTSGSAPRPATPYADGPGCTPVQLPSEDTLARRMVGDDAADELLRRQMDEEQPANDNATLKSSGPMVIPYSPYIHGRESE